MLSIFDFILSLHSKLDYQKQSMLLNQSIKIQAFFHKKLSQSAYLIQIGDKRQVQIKIYSLVNIVNIMVLMIPKAYYLLQQVISNIIDNSERTSKQMGSVNSPDTTSTLPTIDQKLQYLQNKLIKSCTYHRKQSTLYCSQLTCQKCPYLCNECYNQKIHQHQDNITNNTNFIKNIIKYLQLKKAKQFNKSNSSDTVDYPSYQKQVKKILDYVNYLQQQFQIIINQFRKKLQENMGRLTNKINSLLQNKFNTLLNFYTNPNLLVNKLLIQQNDQFLIHLKNILKTYLNKSTTINQDQQLTQLKNQFTNVKNKIKDLVNAGNNIQFNKKINNTNTTNPTNNINTNTANNANNNHPNLTLTLKKTFLLPSDTSDCPLSMSYSASTINILTSKDVFGVDLLSRTIKKLLPYPLTLISTRKLSQQFIGVANQSKLVVYDGKTINQISIGSKIVGLGLLKSRKRLYGLIGEQTGYLNIIDLQQNKSTFHYHCGDQQLLYIQINQQSSLICCTGRKSSIYIFKYKQKFTNIDQLDELQFQYLSQINHNYLLIHQIQLIKILNTQLYLFAAAKNILILDLLNNNQIFKTECSKKSQPFIEAHFINVNGNQFVVTINKGEDVATLWEIDKAKKTVKAEEILKENSGRAIVSMSCFKAELWVIRQNQKNTDIFAITME